MGSQEELEALIVEIKFRLYDDILMKSPLWVELVEMKGVEKEYSVQSDNVFRARVIGRESDPQPKNLSDIEIMQQQILYYYDKVKFR